MEILLNNQVVISSKYDRDPDKILADLFSSIPNLECWSVSALERLYSGVHEIVRLYCMEIKDQVRGSARSKITKFLNKELYMPRNSYSDTERYRKSLLKLIYECILRAEGLGVLRGFGISNRFGDKLHGNPEKQSIVSI